MEVCSLCYCPCKYTHLEGGVGSKCCHTDVIEAEWIGDTVQKARYTYKADGITKGERYRKYAWKLEDDTIEIGRQKI